MLFGDGSGDGFCVTIRTQYRVRSLMTDSSVVACVLACRPG